MSKGVSLRPSSFTDDKSDLVSLSLEEVVSLFLDGEKRRHKLAKDDENQQEDTVGFRVVPAGLVMTLDGNARRLGITRAVLTRCVSHQIAAWLDSIDQVRKVVEMFGVVCDAAEEFGYPDLYDRMSPDYVFTNSSPRPMSFRTVRWVKNKLYGLSQPLGVPVGVLFIVGLCYSLTRTGAESRGVVNKYLSVEVDSFLRHADERAVWVCGFNDLVRRRASTDGLDNTTT